MRDIASLCSRLKAVLRVEVQGCLEEWVGRNLASAGAYVAW